MKKATKITYWASTIFLSFGMLAGGSQQLLQTGGYVEIVRALGYPVYMLSILGFWKIAGVIIILLPGMRTAKEWAYAGFTFAMSGAAASHLIMRQSFTEAVPSLILLLVTLISWYTRPANRKIPSFQSQKNLATSF